MDGINSRRARFWQALRKWILYALLLLVCTALQTMPGLFAVGRFKPFFILAVCLAVAVYEGEFYGALFAVAGGLLWDYTGGRTVGMLAILLMGECFLASVLVQLYLKAKPLNLYLLAAACGLLTLSTDFLFYYLMPGYAGPARYYFGVLVPEALVSALFILPLAALVRRIHSRFTVQD